MPDAETHASEATAGRNEGHNYFEAFEEPAPAAAPRTRLLQTLSDTGDVLENIETQCVALLHAIEKAHLPAGDAAGLKKRVWRIEDLSVKAAERLNGRHESSVL